MLQHKTEIRVRYADTDQMQFAYNGKYFEYFEVGRTEMMRELGLPYHTVEQSGYQLPVREAFVKYLSPAFYDETLIVESIVKELPGVKIHIDHIITSKERNQVVAEGYIELVFTKKETRKPTRPPEFFLAKMKPFFETSI